jgi:SAM-dependent methyltransferase
MTEFEPMDDDDLQWLNVVRAAELENILAITSGLKGNVLEIGGGTGSQAAALHRLGVNVTSIEMATSNYRYARVFPLVEYDGLHIPFEDEAFDTIFSSNVLEHVSRLDVLQAEMMRVLKPGGRAIHVMPSHTWRLWSILTHYIWLVQKSIPSAGGRVVESSSEAVPDLAQINRTAASRVMRAIVPARHGERGNVLTELFYFRPNWLRHHFEEAGWIIEDVLPVPMFYTGYMILKSRLDLSFRRKLAGYFGSASTCFILSKLGTAGE